MTTLSVIGSFILAILLQLFAVLVVFLYGFNRIFGTVLLIVVAIAAAFITPWSLVLGVPLMLASLAIAITPMRQAVLTKPVYNLLAAAMPSMSDTEREALDAGTSWWEKELFMGAPNWDTFANYPYPRLSAKEQAFLDNEVNTLCAMLDEWQIQHYDKDLPPAAWQYIKDQGFLGLIIPESYGGRDFSAYAQSRIMSKIGSRSLTAAVTCMVPNSLGPGELLLHYGTEAQKQRWLPGLACGTEIPCFGLTGLDAGSDAGAIPDTGVVCYGMYEGREVLGLNMTFSKRWITLAPVATVIGLAFKLYDPNKLLGSLLGDSPADLSGSSTLATTIDKNKTDYGITCALIPANYKGVQTGPRHNPGSPFMNGTVVGKDVFIPLDFIIGGIENAGKGWRMLMECLGVGRGISLPALSTSAAEMGYLTVGAFAKIREQFKISVGKFEGVQEASSAIASQTYMLEAFRHLVTCGLNQGGTPSVMTAMAKYYATETMRDLVNHGMDIVGGRAIQQGPRNFLAPGYQAIPVSITVEGANILTRSLMIFGQGAMRCHPYLYHELQLLQSADKQQALPAFDELLLKHLGYTANRGAISFVAGYFGTSFGATAHTAPHFADRFTRPYYKKINRLSANFALTADMALGILAGDLKRKEMLSGRLADIHAHLFIMSAILQYYANGTQSQAEQLHARLALDNALYVIQDAFFDFYANFPKRWAANMVKWVCFPLGRIAAKPNDALKQQLGELIMQDGDNNPFREQLKQYVYYNTMPDDVTGRIENAYQLLLKTEPLWQKFKKAEHHGEFAGLSFEDHMLSALKDGTITEAESEQLIEYNAVRFDALLTDVFDQHLFEAQPRYNPHTLENAAENLTAYLFDEDDSRSHPATAPAAAVVDAALIKADLIDSALVENDLIDNDLVDSTLIENDFATKKAIDAEVLSPTLIDHDSDDDNADSDNGNDDSDNGNDDNGTDLLAARKRDAQRLLEQRMAKNHEYHSPLDADSSDD